MLLLGLPLGLPGGPLWGLLWGCQLECEFDSYADGPAVRITAFALRDQLPGFFYFSHCSIWGLG